MQVIRSEWMQDRARLEYAHREDVYQMTKEKKELEAQVANWKLKGDKWNKHKANLEKERQELTGRVQRVNSELVLLKGKAGSETAAKTKQEEQMRQVMSLAAGSEDTGLSAEERLEQIANILR